LQNGQKYNYHQIGADLISSFAVAEKQQIKKNGHTVANNIDSRNMQGSCDPTNSWTLRTIGYTKVPHGQFLKTALPFGCLMVVVTSAICYYMFG
jgi:hypothetical protein